MLRIPFLYSFGPGRTRSPFRLLVRYIFNDTNVVHYNGAILSLRYYPPDILEVIGINLVEAIESRSTRSARLTHLLFTDQVKLNFSLDTF